MVEIIVGIGENAGCQHFLVSQDCFLKAFHQARRKSSFHDTELTFPKRQILYSSKLEEFADDNFILDKNAKKFSKPLENTVGNGEIARYEQFLLFQQCFQKTSTAGT